MPGRVPLPAAPCAMQSCSMHIRDWPESERPREKLIARGKVVRPGKTLIVTQAEVFAVKDGKESLCALMQQTIMTVTRSEKPKTAPRGEPEK